MWVIKCLDEGKKGVVGVRLPEVRVFILTVSIFPSTALEVYSYQILLGVLVLQEPEMGTRMQKMITI